MKKKIKIQFCVIGILSIIFTVLLMLLVFNEVFKKEVIFELELSADILKNSDLSKFEEEPEKWEALRDIRITLMELDGKVIFDNYVDASVLENHKGRPEVLEAIEYGKGTSIRSSSTLGIYTYYYAVLVQDKYILRVSKEANNSWFILIKAIPGIFLFSIILFICCIILADILTKRILTPIKKMVKQIIRNEKGIIIYEELLPVVETIQKQRDDILEQMKHLKQETTKIQMISEKMEEGLLLLDSNKKLIIANPSAMKLLNSKISDYQGKRLEDFSTNYTLVQCINLALTGKKEDTDLIIEGRNLQIFSNPVLDENHQIIGAMCFILDVTENIRNEKLRRDFTANVSHELKTPLTAISGYAELIEQGMVPQDEIGDFATKIHKSANRLLGLINDIIKLSQLDETIEVKNFTKLNLYDIAQECVYTLENNAKKNNITVILDGENGMIHGNKEMLEELIYNLCGNAIQYNKFNGSVTVTIKCTNNQVQLAVRDTGIGIPEKYQQRVFERFFRVDKSRSKATGGTGLGLAIVKHIVECHDAVLNIQSKEGEGTCIQINFPTI